MMTKAATVNMASVGIATAEMETTRMVIETATMTRIAMIEMAIAIAIKTTSAITIVFT